MERIDSAVGAFMTHYVISKKEALKMVKEALTLPASIRAKVKTADNKVNKTGMEYLDTLSEKDSVGAYEAYILYSYYGENINKATKAELAYIAESMNEV